MLRKVFVPSVDLRYKDHRCICVYVCRGVLRECGGDPKAHGRSESQYLNRIITQYIVLKQPNDLSWSRALIVDACLSGDSSGKAPQKLVLPFIPHLPGPGVDSAACEVCSQQPMWLWSCLSCEV